MKPKTMMLMVVAIGCGLVASYMTSRLLAERQQQQVVENKVKVIRAKVKVPANTLIKEPEKYFEEVEVAEGSFPKKALTSFKDVEGHRLAKSLSEESYVTVDDLLTQENSGLVAMLSPGQRAVAIKVNAESLVGGFVMPGSRVDIVATIRRGEADSESKIILQNMLVLAVDQKASKDTETTTIIGQTVTLAATPEEAQQLALAQAIGELRLTLRGAGDDQHVAVRGTKPNALGRQRPVGLGELAADESGGTGLAPVPEIPAPPKVSAPVVTAPEVKEEPEEPAKPLKTHTLTIISGDFVSKTVFVHDEQEGWRTGAVTGGRPDGVAAAPRKARGEVPPPPAADEKKPEEPPAPAPVPGGRSSLRSSRSRDPQ